MKYIVTLKKIIERTVVVDAENDSAADRALLDGNISFSSERTLSGDTYLGYEYDSHKVCDVAITSECDLKSYLGTDNIKKALFKYTKCGCCYRSTDDYVAVSGYAEGSGDAECPEHRLYFPFSVEEWNNALDTADAEGCELWDECHEDECF